jgi:hypothetical protein
MRMHVYVEDKDPVGDASYRYRATAFLPAEVSRARMVFRGHSDVSDAYAYRELLAGLLDLKLVEGEQDLTVVHDDTEAGAAQTEEAAAGASVSLPLLRETIVKETMGVMCAYVVAVREDKGEAWQTKDEAQGAVEALWKLARDAGLLLDHDELDAEARRSLEAETVSLLSEAPRTIREIQEKASRVGHASLTLDDASRRERAEEALRHAPHVLHYLAGEDIEPA